MPGWVRAVGLLVALGLLVGVASAGANEAPLADAGLDQTVANGTTVYLDAGGSVDPDGTVASTEWTITAPGGTPVTPSCPDCTRTQFTPTRTGEYAATAAVTDDAGATRTDTLYVMVERPQGPAVSLSGPEQTTVGRSTGFAVNATASDAPLRRLGWSRNGTAELNRSLSGDVANETVTRTFASPGTYRVRASVRDELGYERGASMVVRVVAGGGGATGGGNDCFYSEVDDTSGGDKNCQSYASAGDEQRVYGLGRRVENNDGEHVEYKHWTGSIYKLPRDNIDEYRNDEGWVTADQITNEIDPISNAESNGSSNNRGNAEIGSGNVGWVGSDNDGGSSGDSGGSSGGSWDTDWGGNAGYS